MTRKIRCSKIIYETGGEDKYYFIPGWGVSYNKAFKILKNDVVGNTNFILKGIKEHICYVAIDECSILNNGEIQYIIDYKERECE